MDASGGAVAEFASRLRRLRIEAGSPTYRDMAKAAMYSASVLSSAANGNRLPTLQVALAYVAACGGDREEWRRHWLEAAAGGVPGMPPHPALPPHPAAQAAPGAPAAAPPPPPAPPVSRQSMDGQRVAGQPLGGQPVVGRAAAGRAAAGRTYSRQPMAAPDSRQPTAAHAYQQRTATHGHQQPTGTHGYQQPTAPHGPHQPMATPDPRRPAAAAAAAASPQPSATDAIPREPTAEPIPQGPTAPARPEQPRTTVTALVTAPAPAPAIPLATAPALPTPFQLPPRPQGLVGRNTELVRLASAPAGPVVISGPAGVGKSELALHHAHDLAVAMVDGQLYADLGPVPEGGYDVPGLIAEFLAALGVPAGQIPAAADQRAGLYRSLLAQRRVLVLLENVHSERQVRPLLVDSATSTTIVVGRSSLLGLRDVHRIRLELLPRADSVALISRGLPERAQADPASAERLAELCGDLPLALDIATRKLLAHPGMSLRWAVNRLDRPEALLDWLSVGDLSLREVLHSAYVQLSCGAADLLDRLANLPQLELRADGSILAGADRLIDELVEAGMLRATDRLGAYRLDPLARAFVADRDPARNLLSRHSVPFPRIRPQAAAPQLT
ncbi:helix-turn-helix domain-containing protein [Streptomyces sp. NPDC056716]|uniref:helix-turn-helix domain-containing protein n=1 Tax=unclassified Streptomyces TaxID=2593676 RepID=UPI00367FB0A6